MSPKNFTGLYVVLDLIGFGVGLVIADRYMISRLEKAAKETAKGQLPQQLRGEYGDSEVTRETYTKAWESQVEEFKAKPFRERLRASWKASLFVGALGFGGGCFVAMLIAERANSANSQRDRNERQQSD